MARLRWLRHHWGLLIFIVLFLVVSSFGLHHIPAGLNQDEASFGLNAALISHTLHDESGRFLPTYFLTLGGSDWKQPVIIYWSALVLRVIGVSVAKIRFSLVLLGLINCLLIYTLVYSRSKDRAAALFAAFLLATTPTHFMQSRIVLDNISLVTFILLWLVTLSFYDRTRKLGWLIGIAVSLGLGFYSYTPARLFMPIFGIVTLAYLAWEHKFTLKQGIALGGVSLLFLVPALLWFQHFPDALTGRFNALHEEQQTIASFLLHYISGFNPYLLWVKGEVYPIHSTLHHGMFLLPTLLLLPLGIWAIVRAGHKDRFAWIYLIGLAIAPLAIATTSEFNRGSRMINIVPFVVLISVLGWQSLSSVAIKNAFTCLLALFAIQFLAFYFTKYPNLYTVGYDYEPALAAIPAHISIYADTNTPFIDTYLRFYEQAGLVNTTVNYISPQSEIPSHNYVLTIYPDQFYDTPVITTPTHGDVISLVETQ